MTSRKNPTLWDRFFLGTVIVGYSVFALALMSEGLASPISLAVGLSMLLFPALCYLAGTARLIKVGAAVFAPIEHLAEVALRFGAWSLTAAMALGVPLAAIYLLVRFVKWAWSD
jgi:hypothetical protein